MVSVVPVVKVMVALAEVAVAVVAEEEEEEEVTLGVMVAMWLEEEGLTMQVPFKSMNPASTRATDELSSFDFWIKPSFAEPTQLLSFRRFVRGHLRGFGHHVGEEAHHDLEVLALVAFEHFVKCLLDAVRLTCNQIDQ